MIHYLPLWKAKGTGDRLHCIKQLICRGGKSPLPGGGLFHLVGKVYGC